MSTAGQDPSSEDIDAAFAQIVESLQLADLASEDDQVRAHEQPVSAGDTQAHTIPNSTCAPRGVGAVGQEEIGPQKDLADAAMAQVGARAVILTPFSTPESLAGLATLVDLEFVAFATSMGSAAFLQLPVNEETEGIESLLGAQRPLPTTVEHIAKELSRLSKVGAVALVAWLGPDDLDPGVSGQIVAKRYRSGKYYDNVSAGLLLAGLDPLVEDLLLGHVSISQVKQRQATGGSKWKAWREIAKNLRRTQP